MLLKIGCQLNSFQVRSNLIYCSNIHLRLSGLIHLISEPSSRFAQTASMYLSSSASFGLDH